MDTALLEQAILAHSSKEWLHLPSWILSKRQWCDLECLLTGAFSPLSQFMDERNYQSVCETMRLANGQLFPVPVTLDVSDAFVAHWRNHDRIVLCTADQTPVALLQVTSLWKPDKTKEALHVFGTTDPLHPGVDYLFHTVHDWYVGGDIIPIRLPEHFDFIRYRHTPEQLKQVFTRNGWTRIIAFQTRNPMHKAHYELTRRAAIENNANLLLHPVVGQTKADDVDHVIRVKCYIRLLDYYPPSTVMLSLLPLAMRMAGPREALWHALIRKNYGATHMIIGRDHAGSSSEKGPFYEPYAAHDLVCMHANEIGITPVFYSTMAYVKEKQQFFLQEDITPGDTVEDISGTMLRALLKAGKTPPDWFTFPDISAVLQQYYLPRHRLGFTLLLTGLSGAGKSTIARALEAALQESTSRAMTILDGDKVRRELSQELGFSPEDRDRHVLRMGFVAAEVVKHRGIAMIPAITPYQKTRAMLRKMIEAHGGFIEIYVATALSVCMVRDVKGLYQKALSGMLSDFTGISAPYEPPANPDLTIDTASLTVHEAVNRIMGYLIQEGWLLCEN